MVRRGELEKRLDPHFHLPVFKLLVDNIRRVPNGTLHEIIVQSTDVWDQSTKLFGDQFPYIEISAVGLGTNEYEVRMVPTKDAPSRARMIVKTNDIIVSTTRPHRGAIALIRPEHDGYIASTGFAILRMRNHANEVLREYLLNVLSSSIILQQFLQRSSGGNYPAITPDEIDKVIVPVPSFDIQQKLVASMDTARDQRRTKLAQADKILASLDQYVLKTIGLEAPHRDKRRSYAFTFAQVLNEQRLNADFFHPERILAIREMEQTSKRLWCPRLEEIVSFERNQLKEPGENYIGLANVKSDTGELVSSDETASGTCFRFKVDDVLFARLRPYLNKVYQAEFDGCCSTEFHVLRILKGMDVLPVYLAVILRSSLILVQTCHMMTGNTHPRLANEDVIKLVVPIPSKDIQEVIASEVIHRREEAKRLCKEAEALWAAAKQKFERALLSEKDA